MTQPNEQWERSPRLQRLALVAAVCGVAGFGVEMIHKRAGVWVLGGDGGMPLWIVAVYAVCIAAAGLAFAGFERRSGGHLRVSGTRFIVEAMLFAALFMLPPLLHTRESALTLVATGYLIVRLACFRSIGDATVAIAIVLADIAVEGTLIALGLYSYTHAAWLPVPLWLAPLWGGLGLGLRRLFAGLAVSVDRGRPHRSTG